jgi:(Z)-2-((N-methylformamido)methylene)-5-hydroxybutyrolactone dehydrogenase
MNASEDIRQYGLFIDGKSRAGAAGTFPSVDPFRGEVWAEVAAAGLEDVDRGVSAARRAFDDGPWSQMSGRDRGVHMRRLASLIRRDGDTLAQLETRDNGKLLREMAGQVALLPDILDYFAGWADKLHGETIPTEKPNFLVYTVERPVGVVAAITAWNSPLLLLFNKLGPALAAGCTLVVKPAEQTSVSTLELAKLIAEAGFPDGVFNVITGGADVGAALVRHRGVDKVAFTGSTRAGIDVAQGAAGHLATSSLELGGKSSNIVFADADLDAALNGVVSGIFAATGQTCLAGSRVVVHNDVIEEFAARLTARAASIKLGDPLDPATEMGPVAFREQHEKVLAAIQTGIDEGGEVLTGGGSPSGHLSEGLFVEPTVIRGLSSQAQMNQEEIFGPVASLLSFSTDEEAVALANDVRYGLAAGIWTRDLQRAHRLATRIRAGSIWLNAYRIVSPSVPFGGFGASGYGRENGHRGLLEYVTTTAVWVELTGDVRDPFTLG